MLLYIYIYVYIIVTGGRSRASSRFGGGADFNINFLSIDLASIEKEVEEKVASDEKEGKKKKISDNKDFMAVFLENGTVSIGEGFEINEEGIRMTSGSVTSLISDGRNVDSPSINKAMKDDLLTIEELGRGASATVYKAIHIPTLKVVAQKEIQVKDETKRSQLVNEISALRKNMMNIDGNLFMYILCIFNVKFL